MDEHETHAPTGSGTGTEAEHKGGMPQLDFSTYAPQLVWLALSFVLLFVLMKRLALPRIASVLETRRAKIAGDLDAAERMKKEADQALAAYEAALATARDKAHAIAAETNKTLKDETDKLRAEVEGRLAGKAKEAEAAIQRAKDGALANLRSVATEVTELVASKLLGRGVDASAIAQAVEAEIAARGAERKKELV